MSALEVVIGVALGACLAIGGGLVAILAAAGATRARRQREGDRSEP